jgi:hypothetical protein
MSLHVWCPIFLSDFNQIFLIFFIQIFIKVSDMKFDAHPSSGTYRLQGRAGIWKVIGPFRDLCEHASTDV